MFLSAQKSLLLALTLQVVLAFNTQGLEAIRRSAAIAPATPAGCTVDRTIVLGAAGMFAVVRIGLFAIDCIEWSGHMIGTFLGSNQQKVPNHNIPDQGDSSILPDKAAKWALHNHLRQLPYIDYNGCFEFEQIGIYSIVAEFAQSSIGLTVFRFIRHLLSKYLWGMIVWFCAGLDCFYSMFCF